jgi:hypothetical protein
LLGCFADNTIVHLAGRGRTYVRDVQVGDSVLTALAGGGASKYTRVVGNKRTAGDVEFLRLEVTNGTHSHTLRVTPKHALIWRRRGGQSDGTVAAFVVGPAHAALVGVQVPSGNGGLMRIASVARERRPDKYSLETADGMVVASGVLVSTLCPEEVAGGEQPLDSTLDDWRRRHAFKELTD